KDDFDIWYVDKTDNGWSLPERLTNIINTELNEDHPSVSAKGNIYFHSEREKAFGRFDIYMSEYSNGEYSEPVNLGESINTPAYDSYPYIAPDESYIIFCSNMEGSYGAGDLYISFRKEDGSWTKARNLDRGINESSDDRFPQVSPDGKYLFFVSNRQSTPTYFEEKKSYD
ncbi:MAG: hypothetical protein GY863_03815, partial [bacterium]|nr:hypothetical protein [bacterium]